MDQQPTLAFRIHGMDCAEEVAILKREIGPLVGGAERLGFDILNGKMYVQSSPEKVDPGEIVKAVARTGMRAELWQERAADPRDEGFWQRRGRTVLTTASGLFGLAGFLLHVSLGGGFRMALGSEGMGATEHGAPLIAVVFYAMGILAGTWSVLPKAWFAAKRLRPDINLLMVVAVLGAAAIGEWFEAATVSFLFAVSLALESWSVGRARRAVAALLDLAPPTARLKRPNGHEELVPPEQVPVGATFIVKPGERLPLDGKVLHGTSHVNQAPITGESVPVAKQPGDVVYAGTINGDGALEVGATKAASDTTLAHIIRLVGESQSKRAPSEQWVDRFAQIYTPVVMALAVVVLIVPPLFFAASWGDWLYRALVLLVIACPCALVISTPVSIVASLAAAARHGVLIKGGKHVETPATLRAIAFDKTGTLTLGKPAVVEVVPLTGHNEHKLLVLASALESRSDHPLAHAIVEHTQSRGITPTPAAGLQIVQGKGATGIIDNQPYWLGSHRYLEERGQETPEVHERLEALSRSGRTVVVIGNDEHVCGFIALADAVRPDAREAFHALRKAGIGHLVMLTGDNHGTAQAIAHEIGTDEFQAELLPADKVQAVEALVTKYGSVAMVGDGVNDAPALARATLGIAMGAAGSDAAIETADIALMSDDLSKLPWLINHARRTLTIIRQNIVFSLAVKAAFVMLTFAGVASLWAAIAADMGASLLVIFNGLRLLRS